MHDETHDLMQALLLVSEAISKSRGGVRLRILAGYTDAQAMVARLTRKKHAAPARVKVCFKRYKIYKDIDDVASMGWLLAAVQERLGENNLAGSKALKVVADKVEKELSRPQQLLH